MVNSFINFFLLQSLLEGEHMFVMTEAKHIDEFIQVQSYTRSSVPGTYADSRLSEVEGFCIIQPVLYGISSIIGEVHFHRRQFRYGYMK